MIHLICGPIGAGKTTYALQLSQRESAIRFSEDEWLANLFIPQAPDKLLEQPMNTIGAWAIRKYEYCRHQIWEICEQLLQNKISIILDGAAATPEQRKTIQQKAQQYGVGFQLHYVTAETNIRRQRTLERNQEKGPTYAMDVTPAMFEYVEAHFYPPSDDELQDAIVIHT